MSAKYVFVTGGVMSSLGKGITASSLGRLLKARGLKVLAWSPNLTDERAADAGVKCVGKDELFKTSDVVSVHAAIPSVAQASDSAPQPPAIGTSNRPRARVRTTAVCTRPMPT